MADLVQPTTTVEAPIIGALQSRTVWGAAISFGVLVLNIFGKSTIGIDPAALSGQIVDLIGAAASLFAIYGRVASKSVIVQALPVAKVALPQ